MRVVHEEHHASLSELTNASPTRASRTFLTGKGGGGRPRKSEGRKEGKEGTERRCHRFSLSFPSNSVGGPSIRFSRPASCSLHVAHGGGKGRGRSRSIRRLASVGEEGELIFMGSLLRTTGDNYFDVGAKTIHNPVIR